MSMGSDEYVASYIVTEDVLEDDLVERFKEVLWGWCQYHCGNQRLSPTFGQTACARDYYRNSNR